MSDPNCGGRLYRWVRPPAFSGWNGPLAQAAAHCLPESLNLCKKFFQIFYLFKMHIRLYDIPCKR